ncbi:hypothetical protein BDV11DRAFT_165766 [Aspergillus similis]
MTSTPSTPTLSQFSTPNQTPRFFSPSNSPEETHPLIMNTEENDILAQESIGLPDSGDDFVPTIISLLNEYRGMMERIKNGRLAEQRRDHERIQAELQRQRDSAQSDLEKEQALTTGYREELEAKITEKKRLTKTVETLQKQLDEAKVERAKMEDQLAMKAAQLSDAAKEYAMKEIWNSVMGPLARIENENSEIRDQLREINQQLEGTNALIAEERANSDRNLSELTSARDKLAEEQAQRAAVERRLSEQDDRVTLLSNSIKSLEARELQLDFELAQARMEAGKVNPLRSANEKLEARCEMLKTEVSDLNNIRHHHEYELERLGQHYKDELKGLEQLHEDEIKRLEQYYRDEIKGLEQLHEDEIKRLEQYYRDEIKGLEQQQRTMSGEIKRLADEVQEKQKLQSTVSNLEQERDGLNNQLQTLQAKHANLTNAHEAARHAEIRMRWRMVAQRARCRLLNAEVAELKSSRQPNAKAKPRLVLIKHRDSPAKL